MVKVSTTRPFNGGAVWVMGSYTPVHFFPGSCFKFCWWWEHTIYIVVFMDADERSSDPTRDWLRLVCECPGVSGGGVGRWWPAAGLGTLSVAVQAWDLLKEVTITFITSTTVWSPRQFGQTTGREHSPAHQQKIGLKIYWAWPHPSEQDPVYPTVIVSHQKLP